MSNTEMKTPTDQELREFAGRIYDLDYKTYQTTGSALGRVYNDVRETCVKRIIKEMGSSETEHYLQTQVALIANMARTISDKNVRREIMQEYDIITQELMKYASIYQNTMSDANRDAFDRLTLQKRFTEKNHLIIAINRTYGSGGTQIGFALADALKLNYYNSEIFKTVLRRLEAEQDGVEDAHFNMPMDETDGKIIPGPPVSFENEKRSLWQRLKRVYRYHGLPIKDAVFFNQSELICDLAQKEDFVIMGRCADAVLQNNDIPHISIYITAPFEQRVERVMELDHLSCIEATKLLHKIDKKQSKYYTYFTGKKRNHASNYDLCLNSGTYGMDGTVEFIINTLLTSGIVTENRIVRHTEG